MAKNIRTVVPAIDMDVLTGQSFHSSSTNERVAESAQAAIDFKSVDECDNVITSLQGSSTLSDKIKLAKTLISKGELLGGTAEANDTFDYAFNLFSKDVNIELRVKALESLQKKASSARIYGNPHQAFPVYDQIIAYCVDAPESALRLAAAEAMLEKGWLTSKCGQHDSAISIYIDIYKRFKDDKDAKIQIKVVDALTYQAEILELLNLKLDAFGIYRDILHHFAQRGALIGPVRQQIVNAMYKIATLDHNNKIDNISMIKSLYSMAIESIVLNFFEGLSPDFLNFVANNGIKSFLSHIEDFRKTINKGAPLSKSIDHIEVAIERILMGEDIPLRARSELIKEWKKDLINAKAVTVDRVVDNNNLSSLNRKQTAGGSLKLPPLPLSLQWPEEKYVSSPEFRKRGGIIRYLDRVWRPLIIAGYAERRIVSQLDASVMVGIKAYTRKDKITGQSRSLPPELRFLTIGEARRRRIEADPTAVLNDPKAMRAHAHALSLVRKKHPDLSK